MDATTLHIFWAAVIAFSIFTYVVLDGFDLGVGTLFGFEKDADAREEMISSISPFWDGNETWLIIVGASLFGAFPVVYAIFLPAFYLPISLLLLALIFRGVAFEFRGRSTTLRPVWENGFWIGSIIVVFVQGAAIGTMVQQLTVIDGRYAGGSFEWLNPFSVFCGVGLVVGYALLGASWLVLKTEGPVRARAYGRIDWLLLAAVFFVVIAFIFAFNRNPQIAARWTSEPLLLVFPAIGAGAALAVFWACRRRRSDWVPFFASALFFAASYLMLVSSFWPYMVPFSLTVAEAAAPPAALSFMFWGAGIVVLPIVLIYTVTVYLVFRGKTGKVARYSSTS